MYVIYMYNMFFLNILVFIYFTILIYIKFDKKYSDKLLKNIDVGKGFFCRNPNANCTIIYLSSKLYWEAYISSSLLLTRSDKLSIFTNVLFKKIKVLISFITIEG